MTDLLQHVADTLDIQRVLNRVGLYTDEKRWEEHQLLFTDEVVIDFGGVQETQTIAAAALRAWSEASYARVRTLHMATNHDIRLTGDEAEATSYGRALHERTDTGERWDIYCRYEHRLLRTESGWKVSQLRMEPIRQTGNERLLADTAGT